MNWELSFLHTMQNINCPPMDLVMKVLSTLGDAGIFWIMLGLILACTRKYRKIGLQIACVMLLTFVFGNLILKNIIHRPRPYVVDPTLIPRVRKPSEFSFPSGHTMNGITAALTVYFNHKKMGIPLVVLAVLIALSRVYNLVHFPTDVFGGFVIGICSAILVQYINKKRKNTIVSTH